MKKLLALVLGLCLVSGMCWAAPKAATAHPGNPAPASLKEKEKLVLELVRIKARDHTISYQLLSPDEFKTMAAEIKDEARYMPRALSLAEDAWRKDEQTSKKPFPTSACHNTRSDFRASGLQSASWVMPFA